MFEPKNKKIVMAFGTFDYFHEGHEYYLKKAKELGDYLIVVIARDLTVRQTKGEVPVHNEGSRVHAVRQSGIADRVILGFHGDKHKVLKKYRPSVIALGYDQFIFTQKLEKTLIDIKLNAVVQRVEAFFPQVYKSSLIKRSLQEKEEIQETLPHPSKTQKI